MVIFLIYPLSLIPKLLPLLYLSDIIGPYYAIYKNRHQILRQLLNKLTVLRFTVLLITSSSVVSLIFMCRRSQVLFCFEHVSPRAVSVL